MLAALLVVFREVLESALIISIVMAASRGIPGRNAAIGGGVAAGVVGSGLVALFAGAIASAAEGMGMELFNAVILGLAVLMLGWHNIWMAQHGREMAKHAGEIGRAVHDGIRPIYALSVVVGVAVLREGSETVLFMYGILASGKESVWMVLAGGLLGLAAGVAVGVALYQGMLRLKLSRLFAVSGWMILLLACGLAAQCAGLLVQADILPPLGTAIWDTSAILPESSLVGQILHTLVGYVSRPDGVQLLVYVITFVIIGGMMRRVSITPKTAIAAAVVITSVAWMAPSPAQAGFKVTSPIIDHREMEIEYNGSTTFDSDRSKHNAQGHKFEIGYGVLPWWKIELESEVEAEPQGDFRYTTAALENFFQLTPQGKYWADVGLLVEYARAARRSEGDAVKFGPLLQKETGGFSGHGMLHTVNLFLKQGVGSHSSHTTGMSYATQSRLRLNPLFEPGMELHGSVSDFDHTGSFDQQKHYMGPMFAGKYNLADRGIGSGKVKYELGYLLPLTRKAEDGVLRWHMEYEIPF